MTQQIKLKPGKKKKRKKHPLSMLVQVLAALLPTQLLAEVHRKAGWPKYPGCCTMWETLMELETPAFRLTQP